jgi:hypothetical protein
MCYVITLRLIILKEVTIVLMVANTGYRMLQDLLLDMIVELYRKSESNQ